VPRKITEAEMIVKTKGDQLMPFSGLFYGIKSFKSGVCLYFKSESEQAVFVEVSFSELENFRIKGLSDDARKASFIVDPGC